MTSAVLDIIQFTAEKARQVWEPIWPMWKMESGYDGPLYPASRDACVPTAFALRHALTITAPEFRWKVAGGRPTKRTPRGGYVDPKGTPRPHLWVEGATREARVVVDITADQFGGPSVIVAPGGSEAHISNATAKLLKFYEEHERVTIARFLAPLDAVMRQAPACG